MPTRYVPVYLGVGDRSASLAATVTTIGGVVVSTYNDADFSALATNGTSRVLTFDISDTATFFLLSVWLDDGSKQIGGTLLIEPEFSSAGLATSSELDDAKDEIIGAARVNVLPLTATVANNAYYTTGLEELQLSINQLESRTFEITITDSSGAAIDLTGLTLRFLVRDQNLSAGSTSGGKFKIESGENLSVVGDGNNQVHVRVADTLTSTLRNFSGRWELWDVSGERMLGKGPFKVASALRDVT